jgi:hypothetical protein
MIDVDEKTFAALFRAALPLISILLLAFAQSVSFSIVSRSRNRNNMRYHLIASVFSNAVWFLTFRQLMLGDMNLILFIPYTIGTVSGSLAGVRVSMAIERWLGADSDGHLKKPAGEPGSYRTV